MNFQCKRRAGANNSYHNTSGGYLQPLSTSLGSIVSTRCLNTFYCVKKVTHLNNVIIVYIVLNGFLLKHFPIYLYSLQCAPLPEARADVLPTCAGARRAGHGRRLRLHVPLRFLQFPCCYIWLCSFWGEYLYGLIVRGHF